ncbi:hypothetical protein SSAG_05548 [Streptomyces sp. Mg1]|nr:hypothetical protein SSAG_05548 [Streptomyces sp. Mg1]
MLRSTVCVSRLQHCSTSRYLVIGPVWTAPCPSLGETRVTRRPARPPRNGASAATGCFQPVAALRYSGAHAPGRTDPIRRGRPSGSGRTRSAGRDPRSP